jgi:DNA polymerase I-like protein with 3'-5' exonuclease and polymerase domains
MRFVKPLPTICFVDIESTGADRWREDLPFAVSVLWGDPIQPDFEYFEWPVNPLTRGVTPDPKDILRIREFMENPSVTCCGHFFKKFDVPMLAKLGVGCEGPIEDTLIAAKVCHNLELTYGLKDLAWRRFRYPKEDMEDLKGHVKKMQRRATKIGWKVASKVEPDYWLCRYVDTLMPELPNEERDRIRNACAVYCIGDTIRTNLIWGKCSAEMAKDPLLANTYALEMELLNGAITAMEERGVTISKSRCEEQLEYSKKKATGHLKIMHEMLGDPEFNPDSPPQLSKVLYKDPYNLHSIKKSRCGMDSTDWKSLRPHQEHPFVRELLMYRSASKACGTFFEKALRVMQPGPDEDTFVIRCSWNQLGAQSTGRLSSSGDMNLQQQPNPESSPRGTDVHGRYPFGPRKGYTWFSMDYSKMELMVFADMANVTGILEVLAKGEDPNNHITNMAWGGKGNPAALEAAAHALELGHDDPTRQEIQDVWNTFGWNTEKAKYGMRSALALETADLWLSEFDYNIVKAEKSIEKSQSRQRGKTVMFVKQYGGGATALTDLLFCSVVEAKKFIDQLDRAFPEINQYIKAISAQAIEQGFIVTRYGRKLYVDPDTPYRASNYSVQGTCADLMKDALRRCYKFLKETELDAHIIMTIHDEIMFEIRNDHCFKWVLRELARIMTDHEGRLRVNMAVEVKKCTHNWETKVPVPL